MPVEILSSNCGEKSHFIYIDGPLAARFFISRFSGGRIENVPGDRHQVIGSNFAVVAIRVSL